jgi:ATP-binding protein involved in chromosome partitioning
VGKSTVSLNLALYLSGKGAKVGILDADLYGPSLKKMLPEEVLPLQHPDNKERILPAESRGIKLISMAYFLNGDNPASVRAPIANGIIKQFLHLVEWENLDYLIIDFPPGTGDIQLTLIQEGCLSGAVIVTTPQEISLLDVSKAVSMFREMQVPVIGLVENMSFYPVDEKTVLYPFGKEGGERFAKESNTYFLGKIPIDPEISRCCDRGESIFALSPRGAAALSFASIAEKIADQLDSYQTLSVGIFIHAIEQKDPHGFTIEWSDGIISEYRCSDLQRRCSCARCRDERTGKMLVDPSSIPDDVRAMRLVSVGKYALQIFFSSGCSKGIYPFKLLRDWPRT